MSDSAPALPTTPSFDLRHKRVLVTGASSGIGLGCAVAVAQAGAETLVVARREADLRQVAQQLNDQGHRCSYAVLDMSDIEALQQFMFEQSAFDVVINSAGMGGHGAALEATPERFQQVMKINLEAAYFLSTAAARQMIAAGKGGSIVHISSQMGKTGGIERSIYCASKHGLEGMIKAMAIEWGEHNIRINTVCPTFVKTALTEKTFANPERLAWIMQKIKLPRVAEVEDIMGAVLFLASDASAMMTGSSLLIDGGWTAG